MIISQPDAGIPESVLTTQGDLVRRGASASERVAIGAANTVLKSDGTDGDWGMITNANIDAAAAIAGSKIAGGPVVTRKTTDETVNNSNTLQNDDELFFAVGINEKWEFEFQIRLAIWTSSDFKCSLVGPASCQITALGIYGQDASESKVIGSVVTSAGVMQIFTTDSRDTCVIIKGIIVNAGTAGNLQLQWAQNTAVAENTLIAHDSFIVSHKLN